MAIDSKNLLMAVKAFSRANPLPLDASEIHDSLSAAETYLKSAKAYPGQTIKVLQDGKYETYVLNPAEDGLSLTLGKVTVDDSQLKNYVQVVDALPESGQEQGVIYIDPSLSGYIWTGTIWKVVFEQIKINMGGVAPEYPDGIGTIQQAYDSLQNQDIWLDSKIDELRDSIDGKIAQTLVDFGALKRKIISELPIEDEAESNVIYMVPVDDPMSMEHNEYMWLNGRWELLGSTKVDLTDYYTKSEVYSKTEADATFATLVALSEYAKVADVPVRVSQLANDAGYVIAQDLESYAKKTDIPSLDGYALKTDIPSLGGYATESWVEEQINGIQIPSLDGYATQEYVSAYVQGKDYATKAYVTEQIANLNGGGNIDLSGYVTQEQLSSKIGVLGDYNSVVDYVDAKTLNVVVFE